MELKQLKKHISQLEGFRGTLAQEKRKVLPFGVEKIDSHLPDGGLLQGALHEVFAANAGIATAFCALLAGKLAKEAEKGSILWCERPRILDSGMLYGPAFLQFGIDPEQLILVRTRRDADVLWAMEEGLRCKRIAAVVGELVDISLTASRRLQLAAANTGVTGFILRPKTKNPPPSAAMTRWRLDAVSRDQSSDSCPGQTDENETGQAKKPGMEATRWQADMFRCRGAAAANWIMEWKDETGDFSVVPKICDRPSLPFTARLVG